MRLYGYYYTTGSVVRYNVVMKQKPRALLEKTDKGVKTTEAWWSFLKALWEDSKPFLGLLLSGAALIGSALQSVFQWISQYGWAGWIFAGVAGLMSVCVLSFLVSAVWYVALVVRDRRHSHTNQVHGMLSQAPEGENAAIHNQIEELQKHLEGVTQALGSSEWIRNNAFEEFRSELLELKRHFSKIDDALRPKTVGLLSSNSGRTFETRLDAIEAMVEAAQHSTKNTIDAIIHSLGQRKITQDQQYELVLNSLRARDAEEILRKADSEVMRLGDKLISAESYKTGAAWSTDHNLWGHNLSIIDDLMRKWWEDEHRDLIEIKHYQYEAESRMAPAHILVDEGENYRRYKHVCISHGRYLNIRRDLFAYFDNKAHYLPG
jgi:hypothetical protein